MILPEFDNIPAGDHMTAEFGIVDFSKPDSRWMPYKEYIFQKKYFELQFKYFPFPIPKEIITELEKEYANG